MLRGRFLFSEMILKTYLKTDFASFPEYPSILNTLLFSKNNFIEIFPSPFFLHLNDTR